MCHSSVRYYNAKSTKNIFRLDHSETTIFFQIKQRYINILLALANTFIVVCTLYCIRSIRKFKVVTNTTVHFEFLVLIEKKVLKRKGNFLVQFL